ncbi:hypothetical protein KKC88_05315 [Patescibacteria group bacterium]|nr:hypothetical protein [Patescibacteria group bacterium]MBU1673592.1 hypothetical protein [Patescibacteria group bacterium]MBU1964046.1 hypothetical protein [Patescibacteria group bacterium]
MIYILFQARKGDLSRIGETGNGLFICFFIWLVPLPGGEEEEGHLIIYSICIWNRIVFVLEERRNQMKNISLKLTGNRVACLKKGHIVY